jgi:hypothetical protein
MQHENLVACKIATCPFTFLDITLHSPKHASFGNGNAPDRKITFKLEIESHEISQDIKMLNLNING